MLPHHLRPGGGPGCRAAEYPDHFRVLLQDCELRLGSLDGALPVPRCLGSWQKEEDGARRRGPRLVSPVAAAALAWSGLRQRSSHLSAAGQPQPAGDALAFLPKPEG